MAWTLEEIQAKRKQVEAKKAAMGTANAAAAVKTPSVSPGGLDSSLGEGAFAQKGTESVSQSAGGGWTLEEIQQKRKQVEAKKAAMASPDAKGNNALVNPDTVGKNVLDGMMGTPTGSAVQTDRQEDYEPGWVDVSDGANTPKQRAIAQGEYGKYAKTAQEVGEALTARRQEEQFDKLNAWMESDPGNRELVRKLRTGKVTPYAEQSHAMQPVSVSGAKLPQSPDGDSSLGEGAFSQYSDAELMAMGYTSDQIAQAKQYITDFDALPAWKRAAQRAVDSAEGVVSTVASAIPLAGEYAVQGVKNAAGSAKNLTGLYDELGADPRQKKLFDYLSGEGFSDEVIRQQGYTQSEIDAMRERISGAYATGGIDPETSLGYQIAQHGQGMNELAQRGLSDTSKFWLGAATSAGENLAIAAANPAAVLPVLTAQTVGDSLAESTAAGEDAGKALARAAAKGGVSWGIEQFGVEKMLDQMGAEKTVSRVAKQLLEKLEDNQLAKTAPHLYELVSSAGEEALEEFTETYADALVDALVDGDAESWARLASSETLAEAAQSALGGAAGGLLISAGAQGMGAMQKLPQSPAGDSSLGEGAFDEKATLAENEKAPAGEQAVQEKLPQSADADSAPPFVANATSSPGAGEVFGAEGELSSVEKAVENVESVESVEEDGKPSQLQALSAAQSADGGVAGSSPEGRAKNQGSTKGEPGVEEVTLAGNEKAPAAALPRTLPPI